MQFGEKESWFVFFNTSCILIIYLYSLFFAALNIQICIYPEQTSKVLLNGVYQTYFFCFLGLIFWHKFFLKAHGCSRVFKSQKCQIFHQHMNVTDVYNLIKTHQSWNLSILAAIWTNVGAILETLTDFTLVMKLWLWKQYCDEIMGLWAVINIHNHCLYYIKYSTSLYMIKKKNKMLFPLMWSQIVWLYSTSIFLRHIYICIYNFSYLYDKCFNKVKQWKGN